MIDISSWLRKHWALARIKVTQCGPVHLGPQEGKSFSLLATATGNRAVVLPNVGSQNRDTQMLIQNSANFTSSDTQILTPGIEAKQIALLAMSSLWAAPAWPWIWCSTELARSVLLGLWHWLFSTDIQALGGDYVCNVFLRFMTQHLFRQSARDPSKYLRRDPLCKLNESENVEEFLFIVFLITWFHGLLAHMYLITLFD